MSNEPKQEMENMSVPPANPEEPDLGTPNRLTTSSKILGDLVIDGHFDHKGDLEGDITSGTQSNFFLGGKIKGNVRTKGDVTVSGELISGSIYSEGNVTISGKFKGGGLISARDTITVSGEFHGKMEGASIVIADGGRCSGEFIYSDRINISGDGHR